MKNPLLKRLPRELKTEIGKYIALFLFLALTIGLVSGFLVAGGSMIKAYDDSFEKFNIEHGHFTTAFELESKLISDTEEENDIDIYPLFNRNTENQHGHSMRIFRPREDINKIDMMKGEFPETEREIVIDRLYAENNGISIGDTLTFDEMDFTITGFAALSDYSALYKNNTDMMFNANKFTVAIVTDKAFDEIAEDKRIEYTYAWRNHDDSLDDEGMKNKGDDIMEYLADKTMLTDFVSRPDNQAICFTGNDLGNDHAMMEWFLYIIIAVMAFIFAVTTRSTIEQEASVIGTLRASGYTRGELLWHYIALPLAVTFAAAIAGNILGYTALKYVVADVYYHSYSLPTYTTVFSSEAFIKTTLIPCIIIVVINLIVIGSSLKLSPLQFLRHDLTKKRNRNAVRLPSWKFMTRFRIRVILQNIPTYITMFVGILLATVLLIFGLAMRPLLDNYREEVQNSEISKYQYILKAPVETSSEDAEKYSAASLENEEDEEITIYGIAKDSKYIKDFDGTKTFVSQGYLEKYHVEVGDTIVLHDKYTKKEYSFTIDEAYDYPAALAVFIDMDELNKMLDRDEGSFNGYFTNEKLDDIDEMMTATIITEDDLTVVADQLDDSMGGIFNLFWIFAVILYVLVIYLLAKIIVGKNASSISMVKILGYTNSEANKLYTSATAIVVIVSMLIVLPVCSAALKWIYYVMMKRIPGWLTFYIPGWIYPLILAIGLGSYAVVSLIQMQKVKKIPLSQALKTME